MSPQRPQKIGILGAGQLGRMLALAGYPLGFEFRFLDPNPDSPSRHLGEFINADYDDRAALTEFVAGLDLVTFEFENVPASVLDFLDEQLPTAPPSAALATGQDRLHEKRLFTELGIGTPPFERVDSYEELETAAKGLGFPALIKTQHLGYDGKGQYLVREESDLQMAWSELGGVPLILEGFIDFDRELSVIAARGADGDIVVYPLTENHHEGGILRDSRAPAPDLDPRLQERAEGYARQILEYFDYTGILTIELFQIGDELLANEFAPRVHNSGHWTIEGAVTSQFENHLRAITGLPLGSTDPLGEFVMQNIIGSIPDTADLLALEGRHLHLYGKAPRPGRKLGHITWRTDRP